MIDLQGQNVTVSFWARAGANYSPTASILTVNFVTGTTADQGLTALLSGWAGSYNPTQNIILTTSWQKFTATFSVPSNALELAVYFYASNTGTAGANDYFDVTGVQLEAGTVATPFERRLYGQELVLCQRYCYRLGANGTNGYNYLCPVGFFSGTTGGFVNGSYPVIMRATPTLVTDTATLSNYAVLTVSTVLPLTSISVSSQSNPNYYSLNVGVASGGTSGQACFLTQNNQTTYGIYLQAEL
jgi:hypothetical protein